MSDRSHFGFDASPLDLDELTAERLLRGLDASDAPPAYRDVAQFLAELRSAGSPGGEAMEMAAVDALVAAAVAAAHGSGVEGSPPDRGRSRSWRAAPRLVALLSAGMLLTVGGVAAAASGSLPTPLERAVASTVAPLFDRGNAPASQPPVSTPPVPTPTTVAVTVPAAGTPGSAPGGASTASGAATVTCPTGVRNHGAAVSSVAHQPATAGVTHGSVVSAMARSDCGKPQGSASGSTNPAGTATTGVTTTTGPGAQSTTPPGNGHGNGHGPGSHAGSQTHRPR